VQGLDLGPLWLTLRLAAIATSVLLLLSIPLAYWLWRTRSRLRFPIQALVNLPLVLPPTVLGFYLLLLLSPARLPGSFLREHFNLTLAFSFPGLVIGSLVFSLPFMVNPIVSGFESLPKSLAEESLILGASARQTLFRILLPEIKPSLLAGVVLTFAHTIGEFGVALMIGGKIPGKTLIASMAVYDQVESLNYGTAHAYSAILCAGSFATLLTLLLINRKLHRQA
jgi:molybdate transport system permease protein